MKPPISIILALFIIVFAVIPASSQLNCGYDFSHNSSNSAQEIKAAEAKLNDQIREQIFVNRNTQGSIRNNAQRSTAVAVPPAIVYIPVVFHIISEDPSTVTDQMVIDAVDDLNKAYAHQGIYGVDTLGADTRIQFKLAQRAPDGGKSNGVNRIKSFYETMDVDMEDGTVKNLIRWDPSRYANIWVVKSIRGEIAGSTYECGIWKRMGYGGYASAGGGLVVSGLSTPLIAHEMGHYLSLLHTFQGLNCLNNDCSVNGDLVCDTPPDKSMISSPCNNPENSCSTDTLSGPFTIDQRDNISNFMDYGTSCPSVFTPGQGERMRAFLDVFGGGSLKTSTGADAPCAENINAQYAITANPYPAAGDEVIFTNQSTGAANYEWYLNNVLTATSTDFKQVLAANGTYTIKLKAYTTGNTCFSSYYTNVTVSCGTVARFSPDKRIVAGKTMYYNDPVTFTSYSQNADTYEWYVKNNLTGVETKESTTGVLVYSFPAQGTYGIRLVASKGTCIPAAASYNLNVLDGTSDAVMDLFTTNCYNNDSIRLYFGVRNSGFDTIPAGTTIRFYDRDPSLPGRQELVSAFLTPADILGKCFANYTHIVKASRIKQDSVYIVVDSDNTLTEIGKANNTNQGFKFQPKLTVLPNDTLVYVNSTIPFNVTNKREPLAQVFWSANPGSFICGSCANTTIKILDTTTIKVKTTTIYGCSDSALRKLVVYPNDLQLSNPKVYCYRNNDTVLLKTKLCLLNRYEKLQKDIIVRYYNQPYYLPDAVLLYETTIKASTVFTGGCFTVEHTFARKDATNIYAYFNPDLHIFEEELSNNTINIPFIKFLIGVPATELAVYRGEPNILSVLRFGEPIESILWSPPNGLDCTDCFSPTLKTNANTNIKVEVKSLYGCKDSAHITISSFYRSHLALPNVFTPNGDGNNDYFYVISGTAVAAVKQFMIMNRWGTTVYNKINVLPNSYTDGWNGQYKGRPAEEGTYIYQIVIVLNDGTTETHKGNITLLR